MMTKVKVTKDGVTQEIKHRYLQNFLDRGWTVEGEKKSAVNYKIEATADVIEEDDPLEIEEDDDNSSMPEDDEGED
jgi:hypothetical protein